MTSNVPILSSLNDIHLPVKKKEILQWVEQNIQTQPDHIYAFPTTVKEIPEFICVAGSFAVYKIARILQADLPNFFPGDQDIFILGQHNHRTILGGNHSKVLGLDFVHIKETSIETLLKHFDLPVCRAAIGSTGTYYVSIHCLYALLTGGFYFMPEYCFDFDPKNQESRSFFLEEELINHRLIQVMNVDQDKRKEMWKLARKQLPIAIEGSEVLKDLLLKYEKKHYTVHDEKLQKNAAGVIEESIRMLSKRIKKYSDRGFKPVVYKSNKILPWMKHRFLYHRTAEEVAQEDLE